MICYLKRKQISGNLNGRHAKINIKHAPKIPSSCFVFLLFIYDGAHKTTSNLSAYNHRVDGGGGAWRILC